MSSPSHSSTTVEISSKVILTFQILQQSKKKLLVSVNDTIQSVYDNLCDKIGLNTEGRKYFSLCEQIYDDDTSIIDRFLDMKKNVREENISETSTLKFKAKHIKRPKDISDPIAEELFVKQIQLYIIHQIYPCHEKFAVLLASIAIQFTFGDYDPHKHKVGFLNKVGLENFLPSGVSKHDYAYWQERLFQLHKNHSGLSRKDAMAKFIDVASKTPYFGMTFYQVKDKKGIAYMMGISEDGIYLFDITHLKLIKSLPFSSLLSWKKCKEGMEIEYIEKLSDTMVIVCNEQKSAIMLSLLDDYYYLLPESMKKQETTPNNPTPFVASEASMFKEPVKRVFLSKFGSRLEYLIAYYMELCGRGNVTPIRKYCQDVDSMIDGEGVLRKINFSFSNITDKDILYIVDPLKKVIEYKPDRNYPWKENLEIEAFNFDGNLVMSLIPRVYELLYDLKFLKHLNLSGCLVGDDTELFSKSLQNCSELSYLALNSCEIGNKGFQTILEALKKKKKLSSLLFSANKLTNYVLDAIANYIDTAVFLTELDISYNKFDFKGVDNFFKSLERNKSIQKLNISGINLGQKGGPKLISFIEVNKHIKELKIADTKINGETFLKMGRIFRTNHTLESLDVCLNAIHRGIPKEDIHEAWYFLTQPDAKLTELDISDNMFDSNFGEVIGESFKKNNSIRTLNVAGNSVGKSGSLPQPWVDAIMSCTTLQKIDFTNCSLNSSGISKLLTCSTSNENIKEIYVGDNQVDGPIIGLDQFFATTHAQTIDMRGLNISNEDFIVIVRALKENRTLLTINLEGNQIKKQGVEEFINIMKELQNHPLKKLSIATNQVAEEDRSSLFQQVLEKTGVESFEF